PDESYQRVALTLGKLRTEGVLDGTAHTFQAQPEVVQYCAWFCPEEKGFFDFRFTLFGTDTTRSYLDLNKALSVDTLQTLYDKPHAREEWSAGLLKRLHELGIDRVVLSNPDPMIALRVAQFLTSDREQRWVLVYLDGHSAIVALKSAAQDGPGSAGRLEQAKF